MGGTETSHSSSSKKPKATVFRLPTAKKGRVRKEPYRLPTSDSVAELPQILSPPEESSLLCEACGDTGTTPVPSKMDKKAKKVKESKSKKMLTGEGKRKSRAIKKIEAATGALEFPLKVSGRKAKSKKKHRKKTEESALNGPPIDRVNKIKNTHY